MAQAKVCVGWFSKRRNRLTNWRGKREIMGAVVRTCVRGCTLYQIFEKEEWYDSPDIVHSNVDVVDMIDWLIWFDRSIDWLVGCRTFIDPRGTRLLSLSTRYIFIQGEQNGNGSWRKGRVKRKSRVHWERKPGQTKTSTKTKSSKGEEKQDSKITRVELI